MKPRVFIGSSTENLSIAYAVQSNLEHQAEVTIWDQDIFSPNKFVIESLSEYLEESDYAIFVFTPDDELKLRGEEYSSVRDNIVFELGLFIGKIGRKRTFIVCSRNLSNFRMPSDLLGLPVITYDSERQDENLKAALGPASNKIKKLIRNDHTFKRETFLDRYVSQEEGSLLGNQKKIKVSYERVYKLLLYMFKNEKFKHFCAFDLAFERWGELLRTDIDQTLNISHEIFDSMDLLFKYQRCGDFRRILVVTFSQLKKASSVQILEKIYLKEKEWKSNYESLFVETRIFVYPDKSNPETRRKISRLHDFAIFQSEFENLAIVESTLTSPNDFVENPECELSINDSDTDILRKGFDDFWTLSKSIPEIIKLLTDKDEKLEQSLVSSAFAKFCNLYDPKSQEKVILIEAGYFDMRSLSDQDRYHHLDDAFNLFELVRSKFDNTQLDILLDAFINDFNTLNVCNYKDCGILGVDLEDEEQKRLVVLDLLESLKERYIDHDLSENEFALYGMKRTRNHVTKVMKKLLGNGSNLLVEESFGDVTNDLYIETLSGRIHLGYREVGTSRITPRCTALMAQHYYDLFKFARSKKASISELWIFDFNRMTEKESVRLGAEASFRLYSWPSDIKVNIVNCIYTDAEKSSGMIQFVKGPF